MAISKNLTAEDTQYGITFNNAYYRIANVGTIRDNMSGIEGKFRVVLDVSGYATDTPTDATQGIDFKRFHIPASTIDSQSGSTYYEKCYNWLMTQSEFSGGSSV